MVNNYRELVNVGIRKMFRKAVGSLVFNPRYAFRIFTIGLHQHKAARLRLQHERQGVIVPPVIALAMTHTCNLCCVGCYAKSLHHPAGAELTTDEWRRVLAESTELGVSVAIVHGGEPFNREDLVELASVFPKILFLVFTNGTLLTEERIAAIRRAGNIIPVLSVEGAAPDTDARRGTGVHEQLECAARLLRKFGVAFGTSTTVSRDNFTSVIRRDFLQELYRLGSRLIFFIEFLPAEMGTERLEISPEQKDGLQAFMQDMRGRFPAVIVDFPGDEYAMGGCLSAGRAFLNISPEGMVEPCPFSPYSDTNIKSTSLRKALNSELFRRIRDIPGVGQDADGRCALFVNREAIESLSSEVRSSADDKL